MIRLIYEDKISIRQAAVRCNISYPTAKAINRIYSTEGRVDKKKVRIRRSKGEQPGLGTGPYAFVSTQVVDKNVASPPNNLLSKPPKSVASGQTFKPPSYQYK